VSTYFSSTSVSERASSRSGCAFLKTRQRRRSNRCLPAIEMPSILVPCFSQPQCSYEIEESGSIESSQRIAKSIGVSPRLAHSSTVQLDLPLDWRRC